jgi:hypothetical protein
MKTSEQMGGRPEGVRPMAEYNPETRESQELQGRIGKALEIAVKYNGIDGGHHKTWVIDQMVRALTGCPTLQRESTDANGKKYFYDALGESEEYRELVRKAREGEDGPETYDWNTGIAP